MYCDEIVEEVRRNRQKHAAEFNYDLHEIAKDLNSRQILHKRKLVSYPSKDPKLHQQIKTAAGSVER